MGDGYFPAMPGLWALYEAECNRLGRPVGAKPPGKGPLFLHVSDDPERDWHIVAPHVLYTAASNAEWAKERGVGATPYPAATTVEELQAHPLFMVCTPDELVDYMLALSPAHEVQFQPLMGGLPPDIGWASLERFADQVLPRLVSAGLRPEAPTP
jgi:hypothetical protein